jgi:hypothetical protein
MNWLSPTCGGDGEERRMTKAGDKIIAGLQEAVAVEAEYFTDVQTFRSTPDMTKSDDMVRITMTRNKFFQMRSALAAADAVDGEWNAAVEAAEEVAGRMYPEADDLHDAIRKLKRTTP